MTGVAHPTHGSPPPPGYSRTTGEPALGAWAAWAAFLAPTLIAVEFTLVGRIFATEVVLIGLLPLLLTIRGRRLRDPLPRTFLVLAAAWLAAQILTDVIRESDFADYSRGWAKIAFMALNFCALYLLLHGSRRRLVLFALGWAAGGYLVFLLGSSPRVEEHPWKFGLGPPTVVAAVLVAQWRPLRAIPVLPCLPILTVGVASMVLGARAYAGVAFLTALHVLAQQTVGRGRGLSAGASAVRTAVFGAAGILAAALVVELYATMAAHGYLTERARQVYELQGRGAFGVLLGGRSEIVASGHAVLDSPIIGHGSWARNSGYVERLLELRRFGYTVHLPTDRELIPTHSHLMGAWVEAGIMGAVFWLWVLVLVLKVLANQYRTWEPLGPLIALVGIWMSWDILFSPFGAERRYLTPFMIVLMMFARDVIHARTRRGTIDGPSVMNRL